MREIYSAIKRLGQPRIVARPQETTTTPAPDEGPHTCAICNGYALVQELIPGVRASDSPGEIRVNQRGPRSHPGANVLLPATLHLCADCLEEVEKYLVYLIDERTHMARSAAIVERLAAINAGPVLTMTTKEPRALPSEEIRRALEGTPHGGIWSNDI